jgi:hypothetical protein
MAATVLSWSLTIGIVALFLFPFCSVARSPWLCLAAMTISGVCLVVSGIAFPFLNDMGGYVWPGEGQMKARGAAVLYPFLLVWNLFIWLGRFWGGLVWLLAGVGLLYLVRRGGWYRVALAFRRSAKD